MARERKGQGASWPRSEFARVLLADSLWGANWPGSIKARYQLVTRSCRHMVNSSHTRLVTQSTHHKRAHNKATSRNFFICTPVRYSIPRNGAQNRWRNYGKRAYNKIQAVPCSSVWLFGFNVTCYGKDD